MREVLPPLQTPEAALRRCLGAHGSLNVRGAGALPTGRTHPLLHFLTCCCTCPRGERHGVSALCIQVGLLLHMPEGGHPIEVQSQDVVRFKGSLYYVNEPEPTPKTLMVRAPGVAFTCFAGWLKRRDLALR